MVGQCRPSISLLRCGPSSLEITTTGHLVNGVFCLSSTSCKCDRLVTFCWIRCGYVSHGFILHEQVHWQLEPSFILHLCDHRQLQLLFAEDFRPHGVQQNRQTCGI